MQTTSQFLDDFFAQHSETESSELSHYSAGYDPVAAREYYLRNRQLKGRRRGQQEDPRGDDTTLAPPNRADRPRQGQPQAKPRSNDNAAKRRREEIQARQDALEARLKRLKEVLSELVKAAKVRSGVDPEEEKKKSAEKDKKPEKLTAAEKKKKAKEDKERREKEKKETPTQQIKALQQQIAEVQEKIENARKELREAIRKARDKSDNSTRQRRQ